MRPDLVSDETCNGINGSKQMYLLWTLVLLCVAGWMMRSNILDQYRSCKLSALDLQ